MIFLYQVGKKCYSGDGLLRDRRLRDSRPLIGWKWRHRLLQSVIAATSVGFEQWKQVENDQINQYSKIYILQFSSQIWVIFELMSRKAPTPQYQKLAMIFYSWIVRKIRKDAVSPNKFARSLDRLIFRLIFDIFHNWIFGCISDLAG